MSSNKIFHLFAHNESVVKLEMIRKTLESPLTKSKKLKVIKRILNYGNENINP